MIDSLFKGSDIKIKFLDDLRSYQKMWVEYNPKIHNGNLPLILGGRQCGRSIYKELYGKMHIIKKRQQKYVAEHEYVNNLDKGCKWPRFSKKKIKAIKNKLVFKIDNNFSRIENAILPSTK